MVNLNICRLYKIQKMSDYASANIEKAIEVNEEANEVIEEKVEAIEDKDKKKKKPYLLSPLRLEALAKAREKAFSLRKEFHDNKEPTVKKERIKKKSKLEVELENRELKLNLDMLMLTTKTKTSGKKKVDDESRYAYYASANEDKDNKVDVVYADDNKVVNEKVKEKVVDDEPRYAYYASANEDKDKRYEKVVVKTRPSFIKNENGFFCI